MTKFVSRSDAEIAEIARDLVDDTLGECYGHDSVRISFDPEPDVRRYDNGGAHVAAWVYVPALRFPQPRGPRYALMGCEPLDRRGTPSAWFSLCGTGLGYGGYEGDLDGSLARRAAHARAKDLRCKYAGGMYRPPGPLLVAVVPFDWLQSGTTPCTPCRFTEASAEGEAEQQGDGPPELTTPASS